MVEFKNGKMYIDGVLVELNYPKDEHDQNEVLIDHYVELIKQNSTCSKCIRDILLNFMDEIIDKMN